MVLAPGAATMSAEALRIVLGHELFHYASRADTAADAPRWLTEGVADFVAPARSAPCRWRWHAEPRCPPTPTSTGGPAQRSAAYDRAWWFARFVADRYGTADAAAAVPARRAARATSTSPTAVREVLGAGPDADGAWRQWARAGMSRDSLTRDEPGFCW